jgi:hypothetical protein
MVGSLTHHLELHYPVSTAAGAVDICHQGKPGESDVSGLVVFEQGQSGVHTHPAVQPHLTKAVAVRSGKATERYGRLRLLQPLYGP